MVRFPGVYGFLDYLVSSSFCLGQTALSENDPLNVCCHQNPSVFRLFRDVTMIRLGIPYEVYGIPLPFKRGRSVNFQWVVFSVLKIHVVSDIIHTIVVRTKQECDPRHLLHL